MIQSIAIPVSCSLERRASCTIDTSGPRFSSNKPRYFRQPSLDMSRLVGRTGAGNCACVSASGRVVLAVQAVAAPGYWTQDVSLGQNPDAPALTTEYFSASVNDTDLARHQATVQAAARMESELRTGCRLGVQEGVNVPNLSTYGERGPHGAQVQYTQFCCRFM